MAITVEQQALIDSITRVLKADPDIGAAWLSGSLGKGGGDQYSDVDVLVATDGNLNEVTERYLSDVSKIATPVLTNRIYGGTVLNVVTSTWQRFDLSFEKLANLGRYDKNNLKLLFNNTDVSPSAHEAAPYRTSAEQVLKLVNEFLRVLGLLPVGIGREEYVVGLAGVGFLRQMTIDLMLEENEIGPTERGGALRRNPFLNAGQLSELAALAPVGPTRESVITANLELAKIFLPRARRLAARVGATWPQDLETATADHLLKQLGVTLPGG